MPIFLKNLSFMLKTLKATGVALLLGYFNLQAQVTRAPAYPLITHNPYFSIWSDTDTLNKSVTHHRTGQEQSVLGLVKVDKQLYRFIRQAGIQYKPMLATSQEQGYSCKYIIVFTAG
jgi:hypothetical protein